MYIIISLTQLHTHSSINTDSDADIQGPRGEEQVQGYIENHSQTVVYADSTTKGKFWSKVSLQ